jgi:CRISPR-associated protein Cas1
VQTLCEAGIPVCYFSQGGWFYGITHGLGVKNIYLRREQFRLADVPGFCLRLSRELVAGKIRNQRVMLQRNHIEPPPQALAIMKCLCEDAERAETAEQLLGIEGNAARIYFENFSCMIKRGGGANNAEVQAEEHRPEDNSDAAEFSFDFSSRNRRPPRDPVNALLSYGYSILHHQCSSALQTTGLDPYIGFLHSSQYSKPALALDLMEEFRAPIVDSVVITLVNNRVLQRDDFIEEMGTYRLKDDARRTFLEKFEERMHTNIVHPVFKYQATYRRCIELQARLLAKTLDGEIRDYIPFKVR